MQKKMLSFALLMLPLVPLRAAESLTGLEFAGYLSGMPSVVVQNPGSEVWWQALAHNRLNIGWQFASAWRVDAGVRNRLMAGSSAMLNPDDIGFDNGRADLSWNLAHDKNALLNTSLDRLFITFEQHKWKVQLGRQRINWGQTLVWNPNDIFNTHSFFDFDYAERSGCDALRATFFHSETTSTEFASSLNHEGKTTAALLHHWNRHGFDYQLIAGELAQTEAVLGAAWSGDFVGLNFRGECSYFHPLQKMADTSGIIALSVGFDYVFASSLMLQAEALYNGTPASSTSSAAQQGSLLGLYAAPLSAKNLSLCPWNLFAQASYPLTPRLNASLSGMYFVELKSCYVGLSADFSLGNNLDLSAIVQQFATLSNSGLGRMNVMLGFVRLRWAF